MTDAPTTEELFRDDGYLDHCTARVIGHAEGAVVLDRTVFYAQGGGQPGDSGRLVLPEGGELAVVNTVTSRDDGRHLHLLAEGAALPPVGTEVVAHIDWPRRHRLMRIHTCLHLLCAIVDGAVTGGSVGEGKGRLDFDIPEASLDKDDLTARLNALIAADHPVAPTWIEEAELDANPEMVRTMSVAPPRGAGRVRVLEIGAEPAALIDRQPCGGTHVARTGEIGPVVVTKIEKKGRQNRRVNVAFAPEGQPA
ncbi:alanyl-tRNA editing protein [Roseospirillum parvum]|uniref:Alanine--tRNA ligase n=1 Tax=Roseospirillum parvum TaxID=83401 RepID=A0A1G8E3H4_9PROT|nr:alanyl-tRNA editing protein [Roseospirillum parvum]SDH64493.1 misacylated tRNA(Ala) deacylase [Roseospirillum parvum]